MTPAERLQSIIARCSTLAEVAGLREEAAPLEPDDVRELYGELVDHYREDPPRLAELRALGDEIRALETDGTLPKTMVTRSERHRR